MNIKLIAALAALAISAPVTMGCAHDTSAPEQEEGLNKDPAPADSKTTDNQKTDNTNTNQQDQKQQLDQQGTCQLGSGVQGNPCDPGGGGY